MFFGNTVLLENSPPARPPETGSHLFIRYLGKQPCIHTEKKSAWVFPQKDSWPNARISQHLSTSTPGLRSRCGIGYSELKVIPLPPPLNSTAPSFYWRIKMFVCVLCHFLMLATASSITSYTALPIPPNHYCSLNCNLCSAAHWGYCTHSLLYEVPAWFLTCSCNSQPWEATWH